MSLPNYPQFLAMINDIDLLSQKSLPFIVHHLYRGNNEAAEFVLISLNHCRWILQLNEVEPLLNKIPKLINGQDKEKWQKRFEALNMKLFNVSLIYDRELNYEFLFDPFSKWRVRMRNDLSILPVKHKAPLESKRRNKNYRNKKTSKKNQGGLEQIKAEVEVNEKMFDLNLSTTPLVED